MVFTLTDLGILHPSIETGLEMGRRPAESTRQFRFWLEERGEQVWYLTPKEAMKESQISVTRQVASRELQRAKGQLDRKPIPPITDFELFAAKLRHLIRRHSDAEDELLSIMRIVDELIRLAGSWDTVKLFLTMLAKRGDRDTKELEDDKPLRFRFSNNWIDSCWMHRRR